VNSRNVNGLETRPIPEGHSVYLDLIRFGAAVMVLLFHMKKFEIGVAGFRAVVPDHGHDFVVLFFVLSGYVIASTVDRKRSNGFRNYVLDRMARIYSVALPALLLSTVLAVFFWQQIDIKGEWKGSYEAPLRTFLVNFVFMGEFWWTTTHLFLNGPYWSLCYEVLYYLGFGFLFFFRGWARAFGLAVFAGLAGPKVIVLMPCWLFGAMAYAWRDRFVLRPLGAGALAFLFPAIVLLTLHQLGFGPMVRSQLAASLGVYYDLLGPSQDFPIDYVTAMLVALHIYAMRYLQFEWIPVLRKFVVSAAAMSFTLYLLHLPMLHLIKRFMPDVQISWAATVAGAVLVPLICHIVSLFTEARRSRLRAWLDRWVPGHKVQHV
jgi:peptidoglycan/LPS O-acetylase OafA/YrhL